MADPLKRKPAVVRFGGGCATLIVFLAGLAAVALPMARFPRPERSPARIADTASFPDPVAIGRRNLSQARRSHGAGSPAEADALDRLVEALTLGGSREALVEARDLSREAIRIRDARCGADCPKLDGSLAGYEVVLWRLEEYRTALPIAERLLALRIRISGPDGPEAAHATYLLAEIHRALGDYARAETLHRQAISIWSAWPDRHATDIANSLHYLGLLRWATGDFAGARDRLEEALALRAGATGRAREQVAAELNALGSLAARRGDREAALALFEQGRKVWAEALGPDHPHVARSLSSQGRLLADWGDYDRARDLLRRALEIRRRAFGSDHYLVGRSLADLGWLALRSGDYAEAERRLSGAEAIQRRDSRTGADELASTLIERARLALLTGDGRRAIDRALQAEDLARGAFLRTSRGLGELDALRYERIRSSGLDVALGVLGSEPRTSARDDSGSAARIWDEVIRSRAMVLDAMAARLKPAGEEPSGPGGLDGAVRTLPPGAALVGLVKYSPPPARDDRPDSRYLAFVLLPGGSRVVAVPLGPSAPIEEGVRAWHREAETDPRLLPPGQADRRYQEAGRRLRQMIWDPLVPALSGSGTVFVVPDGSLNLVSFATLPDDGGRFLIETGPAIQYLSAEKDLMATHLPPKRGAGALVVGDPGFDAAPGEGGQSGGGPAGGPTPTCAGFRSLRFAPLPGTRRELSDVASLLGPGDGVATLSGAEAGEAAFRSSAPGRRILHLATHGFFLDAGCSSALASESLPEEGIRVGENPLRLSGLALAGANRREESARPDEDGILTAEEIGALDLSGTEWAVLSACETGVGPVQDGEGVLGLRRAFQVAGVATVIMTLWPVDDGAARIWVHHLYEARREGSSTVDAVRQAGRRMLAARRESGRSTHPYAWGGFVAAGDWK